MVKNIVELRMSYRDKKEEIQHRLKEFKRTLNKSDEDIFTELCFCICTPQSKAMTCWKTVLSLLRTGTISRGNVSEIRSCLKPVRFYRRKAEYIVGARKLFSINGQLKIKSKLKTFSDAIEAREWLVDNVRGLGMKEASHFLRNIGLGFDIAILDRHILNSLTDFGVIHEKNTLTKQRYLKIERKMKAFSKKIDIPLAELDLLFWYLKTGQIFK
jgi:N-glycosylase/DNA lyase